MATTASTSPRRAWLVAALGLVVAALGAWTPDAASMPDAVRIPPLAPHPGGVPAAPALFRHTTHGQFACYGCHPSVFPRYPLGFTHADMQAGEFCGSCHDGRAAFAVATRACDVCHVPR
jgi:c(7)-type cytochrome triheme protein